jgi:hypothetical protein
MKRFFTRTTLVAAMVAISAGALAAGGAGSARPMQPAPATGAMQHAPATGTTTTTRTTPPTTLSPAHTTGQPNQSCETTPNTPGNSASAPGSAFNPTPGTAGTVYAGEQTQNSRNTASVSQYDVACARSH